MAGYDSKLHIPAEAHHMQQATSPHFGIVRDLKDPEGRGRIRVENPALNHVGAENWMEWGETFSLPVSTIYEKGDFGFWWPVVPGQPVFSSFKSSDYLQPEHMPGPAFCGEPKKSDDSYIPEEARNITAKDVREGTRIRVIKSEAGATWIIDDRGKEEAMAFMDWTGAGDFWYSPGKVEDEKEKKGEGSKYRKGKFRKTKNVAAQTSESVASLIETKVQVLARMDLNGSALFNIAQDGKGKIALVACNSMGDRGPSIVLDAEEDQILLTDSKGKTQFQLLGKKEHIKVTRQIIQNAVPIQVKNFFDTIYDTLKNYFKKWDKQ